MLQLICQTVKEMNECAELCQHVYERLVFLFDKLLAMERKQTLPNDEILRKYAKFVAEYMRFLKKHQDKPWIYRVVNCKRVIQKVTNFQEGNNTIKFALDVCHADAMADERAQMEQFRQQQQGVIEAQLTDDATIAKEVAREMKQVEALSVLRHELLISSPEPADQKKLTTALDKVMQYSTVQVLGVPE